ncbi:MAG: single-stranded-DNA-specific exonuclease RecJ [Proteobacteria bacterium]|nr:single-stranded-DNA-specific exonuclease RecJ [Pseudomonadota bacterium]MCL2308023.1 single-stranded-DNA-specific exonuclease RecJ [Pseudomonadota bacterium]
MNNTPTLKRRPVPAVAQQNLIAAGVDPVLARIFAARGVIHPDELDLTLKRLPPVDQMKGAAEAAARLAQAIDRQERIVVIADYDADGATACAIALRGLHAMGACVDFLVPNRFEHGYGLTPDIVALAATKQPRVLLTVDNGIASLDGVRAAANLGIDVIITDHHLPAAQLPEPAIIVNPNQPDCPFPSKHLAGVGVMFYVLIALRSLLRERGTHSTFTLSPRGRECPEGAGEGEKSPPLQGDGVPASSPPALAPFPKGVSAKPTGVCNPQGKRGAMCDDALPNLAAMLDLVALGTVADVVPLDNINRILVDQGLRRIRSGQASVGVQALFDVARRSHTAAHAFDLGFAIGPRLNAAGRLADMSLGIRCLLADDAATALPIAQELDALNRARRDVEADIQQEAIDALQQDFDSAADVDRYTLCLARTDWHPGVIGLVASRLKDRFHRPAIVFGNAGGNANDAAAVGELRGSGRSVPGFHLRDALDLITKRAPHLIHKFGGHAMAAGLTLHESALPEFIEHFERVAREWLTPAQLDRVVETDGELEADACTFSLAQTLRDHVWGQGFPAPNFDGEFTVERQTIVGEKHSRLILQDRNQTFNAILFQCAEPLPERIRAAYRLDINEYQGMQSLQLVVEHWWVA